MQVVVGSRFQVVLLDRPSLTLWTRPRPETLKVTQIESTGALDKDAQALNPKPCLRAEAHQRGSGLRDLYDWAWSCKRRPNNTLIIMTLIVVSYIVPDKTPSKSVNRSSDRTGTSSINKMP